MSHTATPAESSAASEPADSTIAPFPSTQPGPITNLPATQQANPFPRVASPQRLRRSGSSRYSRPPPSALFFRPLAGSGSVGKPTKRMIKQQVHGGAASLTPAQQRLQRLLLEDGTGVYQGHIPSSAAAAADHHDLLRMFRREAKHCTTDLADGTFPRTVGDQLGYVRQVFDAVWDWREYWEMEKTLGAGNMRVWEKAMALPEGDPDRAALLALLPSRAEQQKHVLGKPLSDYVVEQLAWRIIVRTHHSLFSQPPTQQCLYIHMAAAQMRREDG